MATVPGAQVIAMGYADTMVLYTALDRVEAVVDGARPGKNGRLFIIEPGKPTKVPFEAGRFILEHLTYTGVVRVEETETDTGVSWDVEKAKKESLEKGKHEDDGRFNQFVQDMVTDYMQRNKPVPTPPPSILAIIERRGFDLKRYGIRPIGYKDAAQESQDAVVAENRNLKDQLAVLTAQVAQLMEQQAAAKDADKPEQARRR